MTFTGEVVIYGDGGCRANGTPDAQAYGSYVLRAVRDGVVIKETHSGVLLFPDADTNNQAEMKTLIAAMQALAAQAREGESLIYPVMYYTDSQLVVGYVTGAWKAKDVILRGLLGDAQMVLRRFPNFTIQWVRREEIVNVLGH